MVLKSQIQRYKLALSTSQNINRKKFWWSAVNPYFCTPKNSSCTSESSSFGRARPCQGRGGRFEPGLSLKNPEFRFGFFLSLSIDALVVELVDTQDLKSCGPQRPCGFDSRLRHKASHICERLFLCDDVNQACLNKRQSHFILILAICHI